MELWDDHGILPGAERNSEIVEKLKLADIVFFLLSSDMFATNYVWDIEIPLAMKMREENALCVLPVVPRNCDWESIELLALNGLPRKGQPVNTFNNHDAAWGMVVEGLKQVL